LVKVFYTDQNLTILPVFLFIKRVKLSLAT
jgi:hypothetical protein